MICQEILFEYAHPPKRDGREREREHARGVANGPQTALRAKGFNMPQGPYPAPIRILKDVQDIISLAFLDP